MCIDPELYIEVSKMVPLPPPKEKTDAHGNGEGTCLGCRKFRHLWGYMCDQCGNTVK